MIHDWVIGKQIKSADTGYTGVSRFPTRAEASDVLMAAMRDCVSILKERGLVGAIIVACEVGTVKGKVVPAAAGTIVAFTTDTLDIFSDVLEQCIPGSRAHILSLQSPPAEVASDEQA